MIQSKSFALGNIEIPSWKGELKMLPFDLAFSNVGLLGIIPNAFIRIVRDMVSILPIREGIAYFTFDGKTIQPNNTHRRGGAHIDGNYLPMKCGWGGDIPSTQGGWKIGENGPGVETEFHRLGYKSETGGMLISSDYSACKGWNGIFDGEPNIGGDCTRIKLNEGFILEPNVMYYGNSQFIHESLSVDKEIHRNLVRITLPMNYPLLTL